jgi:cell division protein FtsZ
VLINITGGYDMTLFEVDAAANRIRKEVDEDANIIFGTSVDEGMNGRVRVSVVATGIDVATASGRGEVPLKLVANGAPTQAVATQPVAPAAAPRPAPSFIRTVAAPAAVPTMRPAVVDPTPEPQVETAPESYAPAPAAPVEAPIVVGPAIAADPVPRAAEPPRPTAPGMIGGLFKRATGITGMMRRTLPEAAHAAPTHGVRVEPSVAAHPHPQAAAAPRAARPAAQEDMGLEIPTFLRRQSNP